MASIPQTQIRTSHAVSIMVNTVAIGQIQSWAPSQTRQITPAFELNSATSGTVTENVPGNIGGLTIQVARYDLFKAKMEEVWGASNKIWMLSDQFKPFEVVEKWKNPDGSTEKVTYYGCWFSQLGRNLQAGGDRIVNVNATLAYVKFVKE